MDRLTNIRSERNGLELFFRRNHLHQAVRTIATIAGRPHRVMKCVVQGGEPFHIPLGLAPNPQLLQMSENIRQLADNRTDAVQEFFKNNGFALVAQDAVLFQECTAYAFPA